MKPLNQVEIENLVLHLQSLVGASLQEVQVSDEALIVRLYLGPDQTRWLVLDMNPQSPVILVLKERPIMKVLKNKPLGLFIKAHMIGTSLDSVALNAEKGRVVELFFGPPQYGEIEVRLFPHGQNIIVRVEDKHVAWGRIRELPGVAKSVDHSPSESLKNESQDAHSLSLNVRTPEQIFTEWLKRRPLKAKTQESDPKAQILKSIAKKENALLKMQEDLESKRRSRWSEAGEWIKIHQSLEVPAEFSEFVDPKMSFAENIQNCFQKAKDLLRKIEQSELRIQAMKEETAKLRLTLESGDVETKLLHQQRKSRQREEIRTRKMDLEGHRYALLGKSASDNIRLLKEAQPWELWVHLKDYPSAHAIIKCNRNEEVSRNEIAQVSKWLARESTSSRRELRQGDYFEVMVTPCRYVRPIKGDKIGRVSVSEFQVLRLKL